MNLLSIPDYTRETVCLMCPTAGTQRALIYSITLLGCAFANARDSCNSDYSDPLLALPSYLQIYFIVNHLRPSHERCQQHGFTNTAPPLDCRRSTPRLSSGGQWPAASAKPFLCHSDRNRRDRLRLEKKRKVQGKGETCKNPQSSSRIYLLLEALAYSPKPPSLHSAPFPNFSIGTFPQLSHNSFRPERN